MSDFSIDIMDFGVSPLRNSFLSLDLSQSSVDSITSSCVNSDGFLPWQRHESGKNASFLSSSSGINPRPPCGSDNNGALKTSTLSSNGSNASL